MALNSKIKYIEIGLVNWPLNKKGLFIEVRSGLL